MGTVLQKNILAQIQEKKISVHALEKRAGLKPSAVQNILQGKSKKPGAELLHAIAKELDCTVEQLISTPDTPSRKDETTYRWIPELYRDCLEKVQQFLNASKINLNKDETLQIVDEVYRYSIQGSLVEADNRFINWFISRNYRKN